MGKAGAGPSRRHFNLDPTPQNFRNLWDRIHDLTDQLTAAQATTATHAATIATLTSQLSTVQRTAQQALISAGTSTTPTVTGGTVTATPPVSDGPVVPSPGTTPTTPPNSSPITGTISASDIIPVTSLVFENSVDISSWPVTSQITVLDWSVDGVEVDHTKETDPGSWPDQPFGDGSLQYTLWIVFFIGGVYYASGIIQYWRGLLRNGGPPSGVAANWVYDPLRWGPMYNYQPAVGENVWLFVTAGNARNFALSSVQERSQIIQIAFPSDAGCHYS